MITRKEMIDHLREHYGLTLNETMEFLNLPLHPIGMRDEFAKAALQGLLSANAMYNGKTNARDLLAQDAYLTADAMLEQRLK